MSNEYDDPRYSVEINGEVLGGIGISAELRGRDVVEIPREDFDTYDYFYLVATAVKVKVAYYKGGFTIAYSKKP